MGSCEDYERIFDIKDMFGNELEIAEGSDEFSRWIDLEIINDDNSASFRLTKPKAKRIIKEIIEIFKIKENKNA